MATLILTAAGAALGGAFGSVGTMVGQAAGALAGGVIDRMLFGGGGRDREIGRIADLDVQSSSEGAPIARVFGRVRIAGEVIWATRFEEVGRSERAGGKGGGPTVTTYSYFANVAIGLCEGPISHVGRVWANGELLDTTRVVMRVHNGSEDQQPDSLILAKQGEGGAPAYKGLAYVVFEQLPLAAFGNALPQFSFEVIRAVGRLEPMIRGVALIPGATEFGYATTEVLRTPGEGVVESENRHVPIALSDVEASLDELQAVCPNLQGVAIVVAWFGDDLRAGECRVRPMVDRLDKVTDQPWSVGGLSRLDVAEVSRVDDRPAYGGTPSDDSVVALIRALKARGLAVTLYPFVMMDVPPGNGLPDPAGRPEQPAYPWRGRITCHPAPGFPDTPDRTAAAGPQIAAFVGTVGPADVTAVGDAVGYAGPAGEWSLRRMVLHYARLCEVAGGVETFLIGSEFPGLSFVRTATRTHPFVDALVVLAADAKAILGPATAVSYAADWTEFASYRPADGTGDHADRTVAPSSLDLDYLTGNVAGGEGFDWYYLDETARRAGVRTPIVDTALGKDWVFRVKDLAGWWGNLHHDRPGGVEVAEPTAWIPGMKPIRFTEIGCPAVDRGANQPNVFPDRVSSEGRSPWFSHGTRDDAMQRRYLEALIAWFDPAAPGFLAARNPVSPVDGRRMVDTDGTHVWAWDARPFPWFPLAEDIWSDGRNWSAGHWLTGRLGAAPLAEVFAALAGPDVTLDGRRLSAVVDGLTVGDRVSARDVIEPLAAVFGSTVGELPSGITLSDRDDRPAAMISPDDMVDGRDGRVLEIRRTEAADVPSEVAVRFLDTDADGRPSSVSARRPGPLRARDMALPVTASSGVMQGIADALLRDLAAAREQVGFALPPSQIAIEPGDVVEIDLGARSVTVLVERIEDGPVRAIEARTVEPDRLARAAPTVRRAPGARPTAPVGRPLVVFLDLPALSGAGEPELPLVAAAARPWPGRMTVHVSRGGVLSPVATVERSAVLGSLDGPLVAGPVWRIDEASTVEVTLIGGTLASVTEEALLAGGNLAAVGSEAGGFEVLQFRDATLIGELRYRLSGFLRGQGGTEARAAAGHPVGARFVLLDAAPVRLPVDRGALGGEVVFRVGPADRDIGDIAVTERRVAWAANALRPLSPVHLAARRAAGGDVILTWIRRTRIDGDLFEAAEVPLAEAFQAYEVRIHDGPAVLRVIGTTAPTATYALADRIADFGMAEGPLEVSVVQLSETMGSGAETRRVFDV